MYILTNRENEIIAISQKCDVLEDVRNIALDNYNIAYAPDEQINIFEIEEIPEEVSEAKYCYTEEKGFYENPNFVKHYSIEERLDLIENMINLQLGF